MGYIYKHTSPSGQSYVGQSMQEIGERWKAHVMDANAGRDSCPAFHRAVRKYGPDAFKTEILHSEIYDQDELDRLEIEAIIEHDTLSPAGYNLVAGGGGFGIPSQTTRQKQSDVQKALWSDPAERAKRLKAQKKGLAKPGVLERRKASQLATLRDPAYRARISEMQKQRCASPEFRAKRSAQSKAAWSEEMCKKLQSHLTPEVIARRTASIRAAAIARNPNIFGDGKIYSGLKDAGNSVGVTGSAIAVRINSPTARFKWWHRIPNHGDPACDAVEECWAMMQFAAACPGHENVPNWASPHGTAPAWAAA